MQKRHHYHLELLFTPSHSLGPAGYLVSRFLSLHFGDALPPSYLYRCGVLPPATVLGSLGLVSIKFLGPFYLSLSRALFFNLTFCLLYFAFSISPTFSFGAKKTPPHIPLFLFICLRFKIMTYVESILAFVSYT